MSGPRFLLVRDQKAIAIAAEVMQGGFFDEGQDVEDPSTGLVLTKTTIGIANQIPSPSAGREVALCIVVDDTTQRQLFDLIQALSPSRRFSRCLYGGKQ